MSHVHRCTQSDFVFSTIYGDAEANSTITWLQSLREAMPLPALNAEHRFTAADMFLMANPDDFSTADQPGLPALTTFAQRWLQGWVTGLHLLPFHPAASQDPHATSDFRRVNASLGTWRDLLPLADQFWLMADLSLQRTASDHPWFAGFRADDPNYADYYLSKEESALNYQNPQVLREMSAAMLHYVYRGARLVRLVDVERLWQRDGETKLHDTRSHLVMRFLRSVANEISPGLRLMAGVNANQGETALYGGNGENEASFLPNSAFAPMLLHALWTSDTRAFRAWAAGMSLPFPEVMFYNQIDSLETVALQPAARLLNTEQLNLLAQQCEAHGGIAARNALGEPFELRLRLWDALRSTAGEPENTGVARYLAAHAVLFSLVGLPAVSISSVLAPALPAQILPGGRVAISQKVDLDVVETQMQTPGSPLRKVVDGLKVLQKARAAVPAFDPAGVQTILDPGESVFGVLRFSLFETGLVICLTNFSNQVRGACVDINEAGFEVETWHDVLTGTTYSAEQARQLTLQAYQSMWLVPAED
jgi:sucrose phosphorylase